MTAKSFCTKACGVFNILAGGAWVIVGLFIAAMIRGFNGPFRLSEFVIPLCLATGGILLALSGVFLLFSSKRARSVALGMLGLAILGGLAYFIGMARELGGGIYFGDFLFVYGPGSVILVAVTELFFFWRDAPINHPS